MATYSTVHSDTCKQCSRELAPGLLACPHCLALVHADQLDELAAEGRRLEGSGQLMDARNVWLSALPLLPPDSKQAEWIRGHAHELESNARAVAANPQNGKKWAKRLGPLAPLAVLLAKGKALLAVVFKLNFLLTFVAFIGVYWAFYGPLFGVGFAGLILIHEMGHYVDIKRRGLPADMPVFLPGLGAYVRWKAIGVSVETRAAVSLAGPFAGWISAAACLLIWRQTGNSLWAALAHTGAWLNVLNLIPVWILDGGSAVLALKKMERGVVLLVSVALAYVLGEKMFYLVAAGFTWRLFTRDEPSEPSPLITAYFIAVLALLGLVLWVAPIRAAGTAGIP